MSNTLGGLWAVQVISSNLLFERKPDILSLDKFLSMRSLFRGPIFETSGRQCEWGLGVDDLT
jgi:hypothetical protein